MHSNIRIKCGFALIHKCKLIRHLILLFCTVRSAFTFRAITCVANFSPESDKKWERTASTLPRFHRPDQLLRSKSLWGGMDIFSRQPVPTSSSSDVPKIQLRQKWLTFLFVEGKSYPCYFWYISAVHWVPYIFHTLQASDDGVCFSLRVNRRFDPECASPCLRYHFAVLISATQCAKTRGEGQQKLSRNLQILAFIVQGSLYPRNGNKGRNI